MRFVCDRCKAKYAIPDEKIRGKTLKMACRKCGYVITMRGEGAVMPTTIPPPSVEAKLADMIRSESTRPKAIEAASAEPATPDAEPPGAVDPDSPATYARSAGPHQRAAHRAPAKAIAPPRAGPPRVSAPASTPRPDRAAIAPPAATPSTATPPRVPLGALARDLGQVGATPEKTAPPTRVATGNDANDANDAAKEAPKRISTARPPPLLEVPTAPIAITESYRPTTDPPERLSMFDRQSMVDLVATQPARRSLAFGAIGGAIVAAGAAIAVMASVYGHRPKVTTVIVTSPSSAGTTTIIVAPPSSPSESIEEVEELDAGELGRHQPQDAHRPPPTTPASTHVDPGPAPSPSAPPIIQGQLSQSRADAFVASRTGMARRGCAAKYPDQLPAAISLVLNIAPDGSVTSLTMSQSEGGGSVGECVRAFASHWRFPASTEGLPGYPVGLRF